MESTQVSNVLTNSTVDGHTSNFVNKPHAHRDSDKWKTCMCIHTCATVATSYGTVYHEAVGVTSRLTHSYIDVYFKISTVYLIVIPALDWKNFIAC